MCGGASSLVGLVLTMGGSVMLAGRSAVMGSLERPLESSGEEFLSDFLGLLGYPSGSGRPLLDGTLHLKYQSFPFANRNPTWRLPVEGKVSLVIAEFEKKFGSLN